jgi:hypothetical protein
MSENIGNVAKALVAAQSAMGNAVKDSKNPFFKSSYADLNAVREAVLPACNANGISVLQPTIIFEGRKYVQTILLHESGEFISGITEILSVKELDAQAQGSGVSYARRYGLQSIANVGAEDDDGNSASGKKYEAPPIRQSSQVSTSPSKEVSGDLKPAAQQALANASTPPKTATETPGKKSFRKAPAAGSEDL